jgi:hypothetical protein
MTQAYCVKCKDKKEMVNPQPKKTKNGRSMLCGKCTKCGGNMCVFVKST